MGYYGNNVEPEKKIVKVKIEFEAIPIRHMAVQCPDCKNWFCGDDIYERHCSYQPEIYDNSCKCPKCASEFMVSEDSSIDGNVPFPEFYKECLQRKEVWE